MQSTVEAYTARLSPNNEPTQQMIDAKLLYYVRTTCRLQQRELYSKRLENMLYKCPPAVPKHR